VGAVVVIDPGAQPGAETLDEGERQRVEALAAGLGGERDVKDGDVAAELLDRKSTRLNSSHTS